MKRETGFYEILGNLKHFIPQPPTNRSLHLSGNLANLYGETATGLPKIEYFLKAYIIKAKALYLLPKYNAP